MAFGKVARFDVERGYGFVAPEEGGDDVFMHISSLEKGTDPRQITVGTRVRFDITDTGRGPKAVRVSLCSLTARAPRPEDAWPEFSSDVAERYEDQLTEEVLSQVFEEARVVMVNRLRARGFLA